MVCAMGFTVAAQSTSQGASSPKTVTGVVLSAEDGEPIIGAHICAKGTKNGTASDFDGKFSISVTDGTVLTVSYSGLKPQEIVADSQQPMKARSPTDSTASGIVNSCIRTWPNAQFPIVVMASGKSRDENRHSKKA